MNILFKLFSFCAVLLFISWIFKSHFVFGGDYLFRFSSVIILIILVMQTLKIYTIHEVKANSLSGIFITNGICLFLLYLGMMMKVSHIMNSQLEKDLVLDFLGIPAFLFATIYNFTFFEKITKLANTNKLLFYRFILFPWIIFLASYLLYLNYSVILSRVDTANV